MSKRKILVTLECFVRKDGKYLMLHRKPDKKIMPGVWMAPGGKREFNEGLFECAKREVREETGLEIKNLRVVATGCAYLQDVDHEVFFHFVTADYAGGELLNNPADGELAWFTPEEILALDNLLAEIREVLLFVVTKQPQVISYQAEYSQGNQMVSFKLESA